MNRAVCFAGVTLVTGCMVVGARQAHIGHLIVSLSDMETGNPITNAIQDYEMEYEKYFMLNYALYNQKMLKGMWDVALWKPKPNDGLSMRRKAALDAYLAVILYR